MESGFLPFVLFDSECSVLLDIGLHGFQTRSAVNIVGYGMSRFRGP